MSPGRAKHLGTGFTALLAFFPFQQTFEDKIKDEQCYVLKKRRERHVLEKMGLLDLCNIS